MELLVGVRAFANQSGPRASMFLHAEEDVDTCLNWGGCCQLRSKMRDGFPLDFVLLVVQGKDNLDGVLEVFN